MEKRTAQKDTIIDITSDSQVNRYFLYRWSPASLTFNNYFLPIFIFIYNVTKHKQQRATSKITIEPKQKRRLGTASNKNYTGRGGEGLELVCGRPTFALSSALVHQKNNYEQQKQNRYNTRTVRKSDYTPALALPKHMAGILDEK